METYKIRLKGGPGSGFHGHKGRPGFEGGSTSMTNSNSPSNVAAKKPNITFRKEPKNTGLRGVGSPFTGSDIKLNGKVVGKIQAPDYTVTDNKWSVSFMVKKTEIDNNPNSDWKHVTFKARFEGDELAREFVIRNIDAIMQKYTLHELED